MPKIAGTISFAAIVVLVSLASAMADTKPYFKSPPVPTVTPKNLPQVKSDQTYAVDIDCTPRGPQLSPVTDDGFIHTTYTTSHGILISTQQATSAPNAQSTLPSGGLGMSLVYVTDGSKSSELDNRNHGCKSTFVVRRQSNLFLIPFISLHTANQAGFVSSFFAAALTPLTSLFSLVTGGPLAATAASRITDFQNTESGFNGLLAKLNTDFDYAQTVSLGVGTTTITTSQSVTTVKVRLLSSLIADKTYDFSNDLRRLADSEAVKVTAASPEGTCQQLSNNVALDGIAAPADRTYILGYEGLRVLQTNEDMMRCLGRLVKVGATLPALWIGQTNIAITPAMAEDWFTAHFTGPQQLSFSEIKNALHELMRALGRYAKNGQPPSQDNTAALAKLFIGDVELVDKSFAGVFKSGSVPKGFPAIINYLLAQGYYHYGCFAQTTDQTGLYTDNANSIFLAFKAPPDATSGKKAETLAFHPIFADNIRTIQALDVSDDIDWISNVLSNRDKAYDCNGFQAQ
jgi:hypothetical protein